MVRSNKNAPLPENNFKKKLSTEEQNKLLSTLKERFDKNMNRHKNITWINVQQKIEKDAKILSLFAMEKTGGEPDIVYYDKKTGEFVFYDCSMESPSGRRNVCYDLEALESRKSARPANSAIEMAYKIGIEILTEEQYRNLQELGKFDTKTSSWLKTPSEIRKLGGALFADRRYDKVFVYHNSAPSYYGARGFRGSLRV
ncbi:MAG: DUF4256 domain-containing protein [Candidatus Nitrosocosmicus sp.]|nr:DUF4256 domain-containing protein [Candidatus Nitrosocosmicus sp.]